MSTVRISRKLAEAKRFWAHVDKSGGCWVWLGTRHGKGYGHVKSGGVVRKAHRVSWEMVHGPIPDGLLVCHRCDNPPCVRPDHLFLGTARDNTQDSISKGRTRRQREKLRAMAQFSEASP